MLMDGDKFSQRHDYVKTRPISYLLLSCHSFAPVMPYSRFTSAYSRVQDDYVPVEGEVVITRAYPFILHPSLSVGVWLELRQPVL